MNIMLKPVKTTIILSLWVLLLSSNVFAGAWTLAKGQLWVKSSVFVQRTHDRYAAAIFFCDGQLCDNGERTPFFFNGEVKSNVATMDVWYALTDRMELQFQVPFFDIAFIDDIDPNRPKSKEFGDIKFGLRYRLLSQPLVTTFNVAAKAPTGFLNKDSEVVPVGDGQWDLHLQSQLSRSLYPLPFYASLDIGYKFRFDPNVKKTNLAPGDEFTLRAELGFNLNKRVLLKAALDGFWGNEFTAILSDSRLALANSDRSILYFETGFYWELKAPLAIEASVRTSLSGKNYPAGEVYGMGLSYTFSL